MFTELLWWLKIGWLPMGQTITCDSKQGEDYWQNQKTLEWRTVVWSKDYLGFRIGKTDLNRRPPWRRDAGAE